MPQPIISAAKPTPPRSGPGSESSDLFRRPAPSLQPIVPVEREFELQILPKQSCCPAGCNASLVPASRRPLRVPNGLRPIRALSGPYRPSPLRRVVLRPSLPASQFVVKHAFHDHLARPVSSWDVEDPVLHPLFQVPLQLHVGGRCTSPDKETTQFCPTGQAVGFYAVRPPSPSSSIRRPCWRP